MVVVITNRIYRITQAHLINCGSTDLLVVTLATLEVRPEVVAVTVNRVGEGAGGGSTDLLVVTLAALEVRPEVVAVPQEVVVRDESVQRLAQQVDVERLRVETKPATQASSRLMWSGCG